MKKYYQRKRKYLFEKDENLKKASEKKLDFDGNPKSRDSKDSLDDKIDSLLLMYEKKSIRDEDDRIEESLFRQSLLALLVEQDEEEVDDIPEEEVDAPPDDASASADASEEVDEEEVEPPEGSEKVKDDVKPAKGQNIPDLDIDSFTMNVMRLVMNHETLLNPKDVILNRAKNFLDNNYGDAHVSRFLETVDNQYGVKGKEFKVDYGQDAPFAVGANPAGAGMSGG
jgi:hypothetical protein